MSMFYFSVKCFITWLFVAIIIVSCDARRNDDAPTQSITYNEPIKGNVVVRIYYFYGGESCRTCLQVQNILQSVYESTFKMVEEVGLYKIDYTDAVNAGLVSKYEVDFNSVIIAGPESYSNITNLVFVNITRNPDQVQALIIEEVNTKLAYGAG